MAKKPNFGGLQGSNWKHSGMTQKRYDALAKAHAAAAALRKGSGKGKATPLTVSPKQAQSAVSKVDKAHESDRLGYTKWIGSKTRSKILSKYKFRR